MGKLGRPIVVAIDGPAASGKGTLARRLAAEFGLVHLDTGLTFRAVAEEMLRQGLSLEDEDDAITAARAIDFSQLDRDKLSDHTIGSAASTIATFPRLRRELLQVQRAFAENPRGAVLDGRDIGTIVCPDADVKLFVTASAEVRARRRYDEAIAKGKSVSYTQILDDINQRDARDRDRTVAPMTQAADALLIDTSEMDIDSAFREASQQILDKLA